VLTLIPANGRDYSSRTAVSEDFDANKDFLIADITSPFSGKPVNKPQLVQMNHSEVRFRFKKLTKVFIRKINATTKQKRQQGRRNARR